MNNLDPHLAEVDEAMATYTFTAEQLTKFLDNTIALLIEYRDQDGQDEPLAQISAVSEAMEALDIDQEMVTRYGDPPMLQTMKAEAAQ